MTAQHPNFVQGYFHGTKHNLRVKLTVGRRSEVA
jgi:hypothetical protein